MPGETDKEKIARLEKELAQSQQLEHSYWQQGLGASYECGALRQKIVELEGAPKAWRERYGGAKLIQEFATEEEYKRWKQDLVLALKKSMEGVDVDELDRYIEESMRKEET